MFEPGGKSVSCQNLHEPLLSPCMFEPGANQSAAKNLHEPLLRPCMFESGVKSVRCQNLHEPHLSSQGLKRFSFIRTAFLSQWFGAMYDNHPRVCSLFL